MKYLVKLILAGFFMTMPAMGLPATNTAKIWPANNSLLFVSFQINFVIQADIGDLPMRKVVVRFDGTDITHLLGNFLAVPGYAAVGGGYLLHFFIPGDSISPGVHTVSVEITTATGEVVSDSAVYTATQTIAPPLFPVYVWPCTLPVKPCE